jgi:hypothetical protein
VPGLSLIQSSRKSNIYAAQSIGAKPSSEDCRLQG